MDFSQHSHELYILVEVLGAALLGGLVGIDRELCRRPAGIRTHMLVAASAALLVGVGQSLAENAHLREGFTIDPVRIIQAVVGGVSFLGAGTIFRSRHGDYVEGLTTAATLLLCAALGIAVALRQWVTGVGVTVIALVVLRAVVPLERWLATRRPPDCKDGE
jgi:putative Mg2+ transporter-C (MgtC) family protein